MGLNLQAAALIGLTAMGFYFFGYAAGFLAGWRDRHDWAKEQDGA